MGVRLFEAVTGAERPEAEFVTNRGQGAAALTPQGAVFEF